jgi:ATP-dependent DNA helicase RecQ
MNSLEFLNKCFLFDIEINEKNEIYSLGAVYGDDSFLLEPRKRITKQQLHDFDALAESADFILGHNVLAHDIPHLKKLAPSLSFLQKPVIDTLYLSPLAFPENPYHRLVKDYKLVRDSVNNPVQDAKLAGRIFSEQWDAFSRHVEQHSDVPLLYRAFFSHDPQLQGISTAFENMGIPRIAGEDLYETFAWFARKKVCQTALQHLLEQLPESSNILPSLAYVTAWLSVAGGNSVLPPWVRHHFPKTCQILQQLREIPCDHADCSYCKTHHNPKFFLKNFFGFDDFRATPATRENKSLQYEIVKSAATNHSLFATLPTGGGKSLCYLLPALMRYHRHNALSIVISPLQALMKDQVDNFSKLTGTGTAAALSGMLTLPERSEIQEGVRMGDIGILFVSPEQLRNSSFINCIKQREIGAWIFDEAHCLSKWGHDFRPDYLYSIRFIRELARQEKHSIPPVQCFTATAKKDVKFEITNILSRELGIRLVAFEGGHERSNLIYEVYPVDAYQKNETILELLRGRYKSSGSVVIYCAKRKSTEYLTELLQKEGFPAQAFHAGLAPSEKKIIQDDFINGEIPIICATNAFGMGIDKDDVRLVIHYDIPGSLENYLQEAGRAGRDRDMAECILIFTDQDIETQFTLSSLSRLTKREITQLLKGLRYAAKGKKELVLTSGELMRQEVVDLAPEEIYDADTRVRTAISWLERGGYLERNENNTRVFQGTPLVQNLEEAGKKIEALNLPKRQQERWLSILAAIMENSMPGRGFSADELASHSSFAGTEHDAENETESQRVIRSLQDMAEHGLLNKETSLTAYIRYKTASSSKKRLQQTCKLEKDFLQILEEAAPDTEIGQPVEIDLRQVNQKLLDLEHTYSTPRSLTLILHGLSRDGKGIAGQKGSISIKDRGQHRFSMVLHRDWQSLHKTVRLRQQTAFTALGVIHAALPKNSPPGATLLVKFTMEAIIESVRRDMLLHELKDPLAATERALTFMNEQNIIDLQQGLAIFRQAMTISLNMEKKGFPYGNKDFAPLKTHYEERNFQIHVMNEYAKRALDTINAARGLVASYFQDEKEDFIKRFFPGREETLQRATSEQSYQQIVDELHNPSQGNIVSAESSKNILVLAGPGSGKTRVVAHRIAFLLRVERIRPTAILALCFNRSAVMELRRQVRNLIGNNMQGISTLTFHGLALRLTGRSLADQGISGDRKDINFADLISDAIALLKGEKETLGFDGEQAREELTGRFSHILVDEYQDIDEEQYNMISLLAGKNLSENDTKMTILAVGDDDQNIYRFRGTNVEFIRRFHHDYKADIHFLVENYRSTANIIAAANQLIIHNQDRMKTEHPIRINKGRESLPAGGNMEVNDPVVQGKVDILEVGDNSIQALVLLEQIRALQRQESDFSLENCAILSREWQDLDMIRSLLEKTGIPVCINWGRASFPALSRIREHADLLEYLEKQRTCEMRASELATFLGNNQKQKSLWQENIFSILDNWAEETGDSLQPVPAILDYFYETFSDQRRNGNMGNGIFLSTVHSVKGMEFDHVFILAENWQNIQGPELEEERRLYYVAMSRARKTLHLFSLQNNKNPHTSLLSGDAILRRTMTTDQNEELSHYRYAILGMKELYIDYACSKAAKHPIHESLRKLQTGDTLQIKKRKNELYLLNHNDVALIRLAHSADKHWQPRLHTIREVRVLAMVRRQRSDIQDSNFAARCRVDAWELPVVELKYSDKTTQVQSKKGH